MAITKQALAQLVEPAVNALGFELADLEVHLSRGGGLLRIFIDAQAGVTVDDCEAVSRQVSSILDVADPIAGNYRLEISSPGLDRRLVKPEHFDRFAGAEVNVKLRRPVEGRRNIRGTLESRNGELIVVRSGDSVLELPLAEIDTVRLVPDLRVPARA